MFFTGFTRFSSEIQKANASSSPENKKNMLQRMYDLVDEAEEVLTNQTGDLDDFGRLLDETWRLKRQTGASVSTNSIDGLYERGIRAGALGGKLLGAGGGGFLLFYVPQKKQEAVKKEMSGLLHIPFAFENGGSRVIHYTPEEFELIS
jgi:D-glycero-alpha-D-manno-heptose-7-phosphate kinase